MFKEIGETVKPGKLFDLYPPASCRKPWEEIPKDYREMLVKEGERWISYGFPPIHATDYMEFCRTGNRSHYEEKQFERRTVLNALVLAECVEYKGRFLDPILNALFVICGESGWQLPAHNSYIRDTPQLPLPDVTRPVIDLFAAETGAVLAVAEYLLREELAQVSPAVSLMVDHNLETRIFTPYLKEHFWWMGDGESPMNNWTSWCTQNVLLAAFTRPMDGERQKAMVKKACESLDYFLDEYQEDGCCDEGAQYYRHAGLTLFTAMEVLNHISGQAFSPLYREVKIRNIADYIRKAHVAGPYYVNFADCSPVAGRCTAREYLFGKRTGSAGLMAFAAKDYKESQDPLCREEHNLLYRVMGAFLHREIMDFSGEEEAGQDCYFASTGLFIARDQVFCLAVKAGGNGDSHNHNDTGSFTIYKNGLPMFIDVGVESYTKKTFSPQRYEIWTMQSRYHNLAAFGDVMQKEGKEFCASETRYDLGEDESWIQMELAGAYGHEGILSYVRKACLKKGKEIFITDTYGGELGPAVLSLMTYERPALFWESETDHKASEENEAKGRLKIFVGDLGVCRVEGALGVETEEIPITDPRLKMAWKHEIYRTLVTFDRQIALRILP